MASYQKKNEEKFNPKPLEGKHKVSPDGEYCFIGNHKFKRTVLPSHAAVVKNQQEQEEIDALADCDKLVVQEEEAGTDSE